MEDLQISPWDMQQIPEERFLQIKVDQFSQNYMRSSSVKHRTNLTQQNQLRVSEDRETRVPKSLFRRRVECSLSLQSLPTKKQSIETKQLAQNLVHNSINEKLKLRAERHSQKHKQLNYRKQDKSKVDQFELIFNADKKQLNGFRSKQKTKNYFINQKINQKTEMDSNNLQNYNFRKDNFKKYKQKYNFSEFDLNESPFPLKHHQKKPSDLFLNKKIFRKSKFTPYLNSRSLINSSKLEVQSFLHKTNEKVTIQKLQNIDCFNNVGNIFQQLKQKNRILFNQLQRYNLFGLKDLNITHVSIRK